MAFEYDFQLDDDRIETFHPQGHRRVEIGDGEVLVNADVRLADGTVVPAVLLIDELSSGEHCGTYVLLEDGIAYQGSEDFLTKLNRTQEQVFPYRYRLRAPVHCSNHHIGPDGWSCC